MKTIRITGFAISLILITFSVSAQNIDSLANAKRNGWNWFNAGLGYGYTKAGQDQLSLNLSYGWRLSPRNWALEVSASHLSGFLGSDPINNISLTGGKIVPERWTFLSVTAGPGITFGSVESSDIVTPSLNLIGEAALKPLDGLGLALGGFVNLNPRLSYAGINLMLQLSSASDR